MINNGRLRKRNYKFFFDKQQHDVMNKAALAKMNERNFSFRVNRILVGMISDSLFGFSHSERNPSSLGK